MLRNKTTWIIVAFVALIFLLIGGLTEYREVPDYQWRESHNFEDEQPKGLYIFKELVERYYDDKLKSVNKYPTDTLATNDTNNLYIQITAQYLEPNTIDTLISIATKGNDVLIISDFMNYTLQDTLPFYIDDVYLTDSMLSFNFTDKKLASEEDFEYIFHNEYFEKSDSAEFYLLSGLEYEENQQYVKVVADNGYYLMVGFPIGEGRVFYHVKKDLFYNYSYRQNQMFEYTQKVLAHFDPEEVHLLSPISVYGSLDPMDRNPLEFIMSQPSLKAAYYLLIIGTLLYVFFGGKRKQKVIPVMAKNKNTSLEYIDTVSQLFFQQGQHEKLVAHMKDIFYHKMQKRFFIEQSDPDYLSKLAKKSKISESELQFVMDRFKNLEDNFDFRGDQLVSLNRRLEHIYEEIENYPLANKSARNRQRKYQL